MDRDRVREELLRAAVDALRQALGRMDADDVPAPLRRLNSVSARRLPPPLVTRALDELDQSSWLRDETAAAVDLPEGSPEYLFVLRPSGWEAELQRLVEERAGAEQAGEVRRLTERLAAAQDRVRRLEAELKSQRKATAAAAGTADDRLRSEAESARRAERRASAQQREERRKREQAEQRAAALESELASAEVRLESQRQLLARQRRAGSEERPPAEARGWFPSDPDGMATELDRIVSAARRPHLVGELARASRATPVAIPEGLRPDRREAVEWLLGQSVTWLVDGYNLAFQIDDSVTAVTRTRVVTETGRLVSLSGPATKAVVVFDSSVAESSLPMARRVKVLFVPSADDWIMAEARPGTVVVSSDRRVREAAQASGAIGVWSEALAGWILGEA